MRMLSAVSTTVNLDDRQDPGFGYGCAPTSCGDNDCGFLESFWNRMLTGPEMAICLDDSKARKLLGFKPTKARVTANELRVIAQGFQKDEIW